MWNKIESDLELQSFMNEICHFHDSCIKEIKYTSGAYVTSKCEMYPLNDLRLLRVIIQRQYEELSMFEMVFEDLKFLKLVPLDENWTCEISSSTMFFKDDTIFWCERGNKNDKNIADRCETDGAIICASRLKWRPLVNNIGSSQFYVPII